MILQKIFGLKQPLVFFDIILHFGSLLALLVYFRQNIFKIAVGLVRKEESAIKIIKLLIIGTLPAVIFGILLDKQIENIFNSSKIVGFGLIFTSILLFSTKFVKNNKKEFKQLNEKDAFFIGLLQAISILPGISRSGLTIISGLWRGLSPETAFRFSFYLSIPAILGALVFKIKDISFYSTQEIIFGIIGMIVAGLVGYLSLKILEKILKSAKFFWFGFYCLILGLFALMI